MAPYSAVTTTVATQDVSRIEADDNTKSINNGRTKDTCQKQTQNEHKSIIGTFGEELKWVNIISIGILHAILVWGLISFPYLQNLRLVIWGHINYIAAEAMRMAEVIKGISTNFTGFVIGGLNGLGVTGGAHRLWCHRSYKATLPLRIILMLCFSMAAQNTMYDWVRDHRVHHKYTETDADPHNSKRGFFFAHVGWLMMKKHPEVLRRGKEVDMRDVLADPVIQFHQKHFILLKLVVAFILPSIVPPLCWGQDWFWSILVMCIGRYCFSLNFTWLVNSAAHIWGKKPYDKTISPSENLTVSILAMGEGWHNYHHTFPWDYKTAELGKYSVNVTTFWLDVFAKIGWAYELKTPSANLVRKVITKQGDGTHPIWGHFEVPETAETDPSNYLNENSIKSD